VESRRCRDGCFDCCFCLFIITGQVMEYIGSGQQIGQLAYINIVGCGWYEENEQDCHCGIVPELGYGLPVCGD